MIEYEKTFLVRVLPENLESSESKELLDIYFPQEKPHPSLRLRKNGEKYEMTKKLHLKDEDRGVQEEKTIHLDQDEFGALSSVPGKRVRKIRHSYPYQGNMAEIDVFQDELRGLVLADFEFETEEEKNEFPIPDFCLVDVTQEQFVAGGMLCGKSYADIEDDLKKYGYQRIV